MYTISFVIPINEQNLLSHTFCHVNHNTPCVFSYFTHQKKNFSGKLLISRMLGGCIIWEFWLKIDFSVVSPEAHRSVSFMKVFCFRPCFLRYFFFGSKRDIKLKILPPKPLTNRLCHRNSNYFWCDDCRIIRFFSGMSIMSVWVLCTICVNFATAIICNCYRIFGSTVSFLQRCHGNCLIQNI